jgi:hypothetical protein
LTAALRGRGAAPRTCQALLSCELAASRGSWRDAAGTLVTNRSRIAEMGALVGKIMIGVQKIRCVPP